ncbi:MAG: hypothetical protein AB1298_02280, partial [Bacteroidota bacterium]
QNITPDDLQFDFRTYIKNEKLDYELLRQNVKNDFEKFVFKKYPEIERIKLQLYKDGALFALMSGSGSTVYGIFPNVNAVEFTKKSLPKNYFCFLSNLDC